MVENLNILYNKNFQFEIDRLPKVKYFSQKAIIPGVSVGTATLPTPFTDIKIHGDKPQFEFFTLDYLVDEDLTNWEELFKWIVSYSTPESFGQYAANTSRSQLHASKYSDATLFTTTNKYNGNVKFIFKNLFPIDMDGIQLTSDVDDNVATTSTVTFAYETFNIER